MEKIQVGHFVKVQLPGETPWTMVRAVHDDGSFDGEINNHLVGSASQDVRQKAADSMFGEDGPPLPAMHSYKFGDVVRFHWAPIGADDLYAWVPAESIRANA